MRGVYDRHEFKAEKARVFEALAAQIGGADGRRDQLHGGGGVDRPVRHEQGTGPGVDKSSREAGQGFGAFRAASGGVARGQDYPVGIKLESADLGSREIAIVEVALLLGRVRIRPGPRAPSI